MKIFISSDMEGTAGVVDWEQCRSSGADHGHYRELLLQEVNAAIEGAESGGASAFLVNDSHGAMANLRPDALAGRARYLAGRHKPFYMMQGLDPSYDGVFFVSYHGSMGGPVSTLSHTYNPRAIAEVRLNGLPAGESGINALVALGHGVPILLITGDEVTAREARPFCPGVRAAVVKTSVSRFAADSLHPQEAQDLIRATARLAVAEADQAALPAIELPATLIVRFRDAGLAELATWVNGVLPVDELTVRITDDDPLRLYRAFVTVVLLSRALPE
ncbi:M55 family metallopeptidase [Kitasatospora sp. NBC_01287]|uniref:M55 family metallopeptidase n=1 Tax=Kitasatospora sp. NBC_01287 TaxID=2903573 RepID=UPI0022523EC8|nr:M55 family metallopeptidase [Kitasatospora sp. NBC_01287]MCX4747975.1 M55 family metallopeptidase [Kitasatospora sp. NBC_01287]